MIWRILIVSFGVAFAYERVTPEYLSELRAAGRDEEFARALGIDDVNLVRRNTDERSEFVNKPVSPLGDIMLTKEQMEQDRQMVNKKIYTGMKWPKNYIPFAIQESDFYDWQVDIIRSAIDKMNRKMTNMKIIEVPKYSSSERNAKSSPEHFVHVFSGSGCWSYLGKSGNSPQALSLQWNGCVNEATVQHEFIHAIGFTHEHNREDRDDYIHINWENIPEEWHSQFQKVEGPTFVNIGKYDYKSTMHYPKDAHGTFMNAFSMKKREDGVDENQIGRGPMSEMDVKKIDEGYSPC